MYNLHKATKNRAESSHTYYIECARHCRSSRHIWHGGENLKRRRKLKFCVPNFSANKHFQKKINSEKDTYRTCAQNVLLKTQQDYAFVFQLHEPRNS